MHVEQRAVQRFVSRSKRQQHSVGVFGLIRFFLWRSARLFMPWA
jgi:hypothetical protein